MLPQPPTGQDPIDPRGAFAPPPPPPGHLPPPGMMPPGHMPPPPGMMPPPFMMPPPPPQRGFTKGIFVTLASTIFGLSLLANIYLLMFSGLLSSQTPFVQSTLQSGKPDQKIAVIPIQGIIDDGTSAIAHRVIDLIQRDDSVKAVVLEIDTPGGGVTPSDEIRHRLQELKKAKRDKNPNFVIAVSMGSLATSGGYYISADADQIFAQPTTLTGNIGVLMPRFNLASMAEKIGVTEKTLAAPEGGYKNAGSMFSPDNPRDAQYLQGIIDNAYARFRDIVKNGRGAKLKGDLAQIADGRVFTSDEALANGLIDQQGYLPDAYTWTATQASLSDPTVVRYSRRPSLSEMLLSQSPTPTPKAGAVNITLDPTLIDHLTTPRLMYLWRGE